MTTPIRTPQRVTLPRHPTDAELFEDAPAPRPVPIADAAEAERRFWKRYGWQLVQRLLGNPQQPKTVEEWIIVAEQVRDALVTAPDLNVIVARLEAVASRMEAVPIEPPPPPTNGKALPRDAADAERRFFAKFGAVAGGTWVEVQQYLGKSEDKPTTVEQWVELARLMRDQQVQVQSAQQFVAKGG